MSIFFNVCSTPFTFTINPAPSLVLTQPSYSACAPGTVDLTNVLNPSTSILPQGTTFQYQLNGVAVSNPAAVNQSGTYTIIATTPQGCSAQINVPVTIKPLVVFNQLPPLCNNDQQEYMLFANLNLTLYPGAANLIGPGATTVYL